MKAVLLVLVAVCIQLSTAKLRVQGSSFYYNQNQVFLSGANVAWVNYGRDFGSGAYGGVKGTYQSYIDYVAASGGNVIRVWVHIDGQFSPKFDATGTVTGEDTQSLINDLSQLLDYAGQKNVFVIPVLWNLAVKPAKMIHLYTNPAKLQSYLDKVLRPLAAALKGKPALAAYDIVNEPMGAMMKGLGDRNPCFNTQNLAATGANWSGSNLNVRDIMRFINWHIDVIKTADPNALVTVGDHEVTTSHVEPNYRDYYKDECLVAAGGKPKGKIDFYQLHSYNYDAGRFPPGSPFKKHFADYRTPKPMIVGEFATVCSESKNAAQNFQYLYNSGYSGAITWQLNSVGRCVDGRPQIEQGFRSIRDLNTHGRIVIKF